MEICDVLVVGGGPAGATAAAALCRAGLDVIVIDRAAFPRDKVCAGWITPPVVTDLRIDPAEYRAGRTWQPITGFHLGRMGSDRTVSIVYDRPVSFGIRRCEFDDYLLRRSGARLCLGAAATTFRRDGTRWIVNDEVRATMLVGAGGHGCPVARWLNPVGTTDGGALVTAQETELAIDPREEAAFATAPGVAELFFCRDLRGYGWCLRKGRYLNIGLGRLGAHALPAATAEFAAFLTSTGRLPPGLPLSWRGHAYLVNQSRHRRTVGAGVLLVGDAAGLACPASGEGIRPAIESGLLAAATILEAAPEYTLGRLRAYERRLEVRFGAPGAGPFAHLVPRAVMAALAGPLLATPGVARRVVLDRWFLRAHQPALAPA